MKPQVSALTLNDVHEARERISPCIYHSPLARSEYFSALWGSEVYFKLENLQMTGSFKDRGAMNKLLALTDSERRCGVIAASAGNHGQAVAYHARRLGIPATIVMPSTAPIIKVENTRSYGAKVVQEGSDYDGSKAHAYELSQSQSLTFIHGFDDPHVIAGQGTIGLEILEEQPDIDAVLVPVGGGGLVAGVALAIKSISPRVRMIGVQSEGMPSMMEALAAEKPVDMPPCRTLADGICVRRVGDLPFQLTSEFVDQVVTVSEEEIANAILLMLEREKTLVEGAGAVGVAAIHNNRVHLQGKKVAIILSGGNIDVNILSRIIDKGLIKDGRLVRLRVQVLDKPGELSRILAVVADARANILDVAHSRAFTTAGIGETQIELTLETRGQDHAAELLAALKKNDIHTLKSPLDVSD